MLRMIGAISPRFGAYSVIYGQKEKVLGDLRYFKAQNKNGSIYWAENWSPKANTMEEPRAILVTGPDAAQSEKQAYPALWSHVLGIVYAHQAIPGRNLARFLTEGHLKLKGEGGKPPEVTFARPPYSNFL